MPLTSMLCYAKGSIAIAAFFVEILVETVQFSRRTFLPSLRLTLFLSFVLIPQNFVFIAFDPLEGLLVIRRK